MTEALVGGAFGGVLAAVVTLVGLLTTSRWRIAEENVLKQRAEWREAVRSLIGRSVIADDPLQVRQIWAELALRMNPNEDLDKDDRELVALVKSLEDEANRTDETRQRIVDITAHILKHDWTRAKWEAQGWFWEDEPVQRRWSPTIARSKHSSGREGKSTRNSAS